MSIKKTDTNGEKFCQTLIKPKSQNCAKISAQTNFLVEMFSTQTLWNEFFMLQDFDFKNNFLLEHVRANLYHYILLPTIFLKRNFSFSTLFKAKFCVPSFLKRNFAFHLFSVEPRYNGIEGTEKKVPLNRVQV
jgi:hypothetical protein